jgi:hypothetical protein
MTQVAFFAFPFALALALLSPRAAFARADLQVSASITSNQVGTGEPFSITVQVVADERIDDLPWPVVSGLDPFTVNKGKSTSQSSQTNIINGKVSHKNLYVTHFTYTLTAKEAGTFQVGPIRYAYKDFEKSLGSASVTVTRQEAGLSTEATVSKRSAYIGEQMLYNLRIIPSAKVQQINLPEDLQKLIGEKFWFQRLDKNVEAKNVTIDGKQARVFDVRIVLFPLLAGKAELSRIPVEYQQLSSGGRRRSGSIFDMFEDEFFGGGSVVNMSAMASPVSVEVSPLPPGAPKGFSGSVGNYSLTASVDKSTLPSGDAVTLTVTIRGDGQPKSIGEPRLPDLSQFEIFDPEVATNSSIQGSTLITTKTFKYVMVPHRKGEYTLPAVTFPYFNPSARTYVEAKSQPITLSVTQGKEIAAAPGRILSQREITDIGSDIRHIKLDDSALEDETDFLYKRGWYWLLFAPTPLAFAFALVSRRRSRKLDADATLKRKSQASAHVKRRLREATEALKQQNTREFYKSLSQAVVGFASDKTNVEFRGLPMEEAKAQLRRKGVGEETVAEYERMLQQCDFGQFSGAAKDEKSWKEALAAAEDLLKRLEREL